MTTPTPIPARLLEEIATLRKRLLELETSAGLRFTEPNDGIDENRAQMYLDLAGVFMVVLAADQTVSLINRKGCEILGCPKERVKGRNWFDHFIPERLRSDLKGFFERLITGEIEPLESFKNPILNRQGEERMIAWHNTLIRDRAGRIVGTLSSGEDVTEWEKTNEKVANLNRLLRTISDINQLIVREDNRSRLLEETCRIIVENGGFRLAWVGQVDYQTYEIHPVAQVGFDQGYLESAGIRFDDSPRGRGPVGTAVRTGRPVVCRDTENDESFLPWREAARKQGYRALAAFPLKTPNRVVGSLNIYAGEMGLFTEEMVQLLEELTDDLSFALQALDEREARQSSERFLREREAKIQSIFRASPVGIGLVSYPDRTLLEVNNRFCGMVGYSPEELIGQSARMVYPSDDEFNQVRRDKYTQIESRGTGTVETRWQRKDGAIIDVLLSSTPLDEQDYSRGVTFTALDITESKQADQALRASEEKYRSHFQNVFDVIYSLNRELRIIDVSPSVKRLAGYSPEELIGKAVTELPLLDPEFRAQALSDIQQILAGNRIESREYEFLAKDGSRIWCEVSGAPLIVQGEVVGIISVARDITERRRDKETLQTLAQKWQTTFDAMNDAICLLDEQNRVLQCNRAMVHLVDKPLDEIIGVRCWELMDGVGEPLENCPSVRMQRSGKRESLIMNIKDLWFEVTAEPIKDSAGKITGAVHIISNITEQKKTEEALRVREAHLSTLINSSTDPIISLDTRRVITEVNPAFLKQFGCSREEAVGQSMAVFHPDRASFEEFGPRVYPVIKAKGHWLGEWKYRRKDGSLVPMETVISAIGRPDGEISGYVSVMRDITERVSAEAQKSALEQQLRQAQKMEAIGTLAGGIAHDFNNILGAVIGFTELARMDIAEGSQAQADLDQVIKAALRAKDLVSQILSFSRKGTETLAPVNILPVIKEALKMLRASLPTTIEIGKKLKVTEAVVHSDPTQIHQILINLCTNAAQAMDKSGGLLEVTLSETDLAGEILRKYPNLTPGPYLEISVRDTGEGISPEIIEHIFEPYFTTKEKGLGTGLGLSVVHGIVKQHGGLIQVESEPGKGSLFRVFLPLRKEAPVPLKKTEQTLLQGSEHILVVDDEAVLTEIFKKALERLGYRVTALTDPLEALNQVAAQPDSFQLVITDMTMPKLPGDRLVGKILEINPLVPIIICTGYSDHLSDSRARKIGAKALLMKPIEVNTLARKVREVLDNG